MIFFGVLLTCFLIGGLIVGAFIATEARARGRFGELISSGIKGLCLASVAVVVILAIGTLTCSLVPKNATGYSATEEAELVQAEFEGGRCYIWYADKNGCVKKLTAGTGDTTVTREADAPSSVLITRTYDDIVGIVKVKADIIVSEEFAFKGEPDA